MSTELGKIKGISNGNEVDLYLTRFYGGDKMGVSLQISLITGLSREALQWGIEECKKWVENHENQSTFGCDLQFQMSTVRISNSDFLSFYAILRDSIVKYGEDKVTTAYTTRPLYEIAREIKKTWKNVWFGAVPYLQAMHSLNSIEDSYGLDSARSIVIYFLSNAATWRGEDAKRIKAELRKMAGLK